MHNSSHFPNKKYTGKKLHFRIQHLRINYFSTLVKGSCTINSWHILVSQMGERVYDSLKGRKIEKLPTKNHAEFREPFIFKYAEPLGH